MLWLNLNLLLQCYCYVDRSVNYHLDFVWVCTICRTVNGITVNMPANDQQWLWWTVLYPVVRDYSNVLLWKGADRYNIGLNKVKFNYPYDLTLNRQEHEGFGFVLVSSSTKSGATIGSCWSYWELPLSTDLKDKSWFIRYLYHRHHLCNSKRWNIYIKSGLTIRNQNF